METGIMIGVDIGQRQDPTAIVVVEESAEEVNPTYQVRYLDRLPLGTPFLDVAAHIGALVPKIQQQVEKPWVWMMVDSTGVGAPLVYLIRQRVSIPVTAAMFVHGERLKGWIGDRELTVGKAYMVSQLQALFIANRIHWKKLPLQRP